MTIPPTPRCLVFSLTPFLIPFFAASAAPTTTTTTTATAPLPAEYRARAGAVEPISDTTIIAEAEEFQTSGGTSGWQPRRWGENYYAATMANTFLSRKAFLAAPEECDRAVATIAVRVPKAGRYLALVRYEAAYRFQTRFRLKIEQGGQTRLDHLYGSLDNVKIWAFGQKLKTQAVWSWGPVENIVWEGHDAAVDLDAGEATLSLIADRQPAPAARRNVDLVMLTSDAEQVRRRIDKENYLPLDGMLTQTGDLFVKLHNHGGSALKITFPPGIEHSPYWVHQRAWQPKTLSAKPGESTGWLEVGSLLDSLNDGQWRLDAKADGLISYSLEFGMPSAGEVETIRRFDNLTGNIELAYRADTRYSHGLRTSDQVLYGLLDFLKEHPVRGAAPKRTLVYAHTFDRRPGDAKYNAAIDEFARLIGLNAFDRERDVTRDGVPCGYIDVHAQSPKELGAMIDKLKAEGRADKIAVASLGDEISLPEPPAEDQPAFRAWLRQQGVQPRGLDPDAGDDWNKIIYLRAGAAESAVKDKPALFYYSSLYRYRFGIARQKAITDALRAALPNAGIGANYSPHHGHAYLGEVFQWVSTFREGAMTMPWSEDYIWQAPVGSQQMNSLSLDLFRAGTKNDPAARIHFYVMPHMPGNTPASWRRQFYADLGHGMKMVNLFEFRPVQAAYTENHVTGAAMYQQVRAALHELGQFEDIVQEGYVRPAKAGFWFSETGDIWGDDRPPFDAAKRTLYVATRHQQVPLDVVVEADALAGKLKDYELLYLTDQHVSRAASKALADWVAGGGRLLATAGAGMFDELNQPNAAMRKLLGVDQTSLEEPADPVRWEKADLPFAAVVDTVVWKDHLPIPVIGARSRVRPRANARTEGSFADGSPAILTRPVGKGEAMYCAFAPGLSYFKPAIPLRPADRGATDDAMAHFIPTAFDRGAASIVAAAADGIDRPVLCSEPLVESTIIDSPHGMLVPLVNWSGQPVIHLTVKFPAGASSKSATLAAGGTVHREGDSFILDLDVADALILR